ncbi:RidA family protein [Dethiosulfatarculus sandiegensis]|uniref:Endoribonuclease L-PSP/chorismate mutase-like domain-containing protein n=1 Tax=Dethiosulfatarculus sandiegensis TaxID=1429043 RepID=A0A0D2HPR0_9BACT|nr:RidA family protein [Dethiosulfatarculus sandiegensis]KIX12468.1 hypothetical protein X474_19240 [Dethiosulfatarculus sandiegensis]
MTIEEKFSSMGLELPDPGSPMGNYLPVVVEDDWLYTSGASCIKDGRLIFQGQVGLDLTIEQGYEAARHTALCLLARIKQELGDLERLKRVVKVLGMVNCPPGFFEHPRVINGASDLLVELFGQAGRHARSAVGMTSLPGNCPVEIELIAKIKT